MITGVVQNGVVVFSPGVQLPEGTKVGVEPEIMSEPALRSELPPSQAELLKFVGIANDLPEDMADNHDRYLHGAPKQ